MSTARSGPPGVLITRPAEDAGPLAAEIAGRGYRPLNEPMLAIRWLDGPPPGLGGVQGLLFTSANGVRAYTRRTADRGLPVCTVGDATGRAAREAGFAEVESADGDVQALAALATRRFRPEGGLLLHVAGSAVAGDLAGQLGAAGFGVRREVLYETATADALSAGTAAALAGGGCAAVLFFSPRTAATFVRLLDEAGLTHHCPAVAALCLSAAVADAVRTSGPGTTVPWRDVRVAVRPRQEDLLTLLGTPADPA